MAQVEPALVVIDLQIGNMGGMAAATAVRQEQEAGRLADSGVIMLLDRHPDVFLAQTCGADGWLIKPEQSASVLRCPSVKKGPSWPSNLDYGINGFAFPGGDAIPAVKIAKPSQTFLVAESLLWCVTGWGGPTLGEDLAFRHNGMANVVMCDGHVEKISKKQLEDKEFEKQLKGLLP